MVAETIDKKPSSTEEAASRASFFRQSGWLMITTMVGGMLMYGVHPLAKKITPEEYAVFGVFLAVSMCIPTMPLQMVMAQQTAKGLALGREREVSGMIRVVWIGVTLLWALGALGVVIYRREIISGWSIGNPAGLWVSVAVVLMTLWWPLFCGVLQGQQNFLWLGWSTLTNSIGRVSVAAFAVLVLHGLAASMMVGVFTGMFLAWVIAFWFSRNLWRIKPAPVDWTSLLQQTLPVLIGCAAFQFLFTADTMFVKRYFPGDETAFYFSAGTLSRALMWMVGPLAAVMFPRLVHSAAKSEKSNLMTVVLVGTALLAIVGAVGLSIVGPFVVRLVYDAKYVKGAGALLPWYAGAMVPLSLANVLLNNLMARSQYKIVPFLVLLVGGYVLALQHFHASMVQILQVVGACNLALLLGCLLCTWLAKGAPQPVPEGAAAA